MYAFLIVIHVIASIVLILVILLQAGRGAGLSETFGISSTQTIFGQSAPKFLETATSLCAVVFLLTSLTLAAMSMRRSRSIVIPAGTAAQQGVPVNAAPATPTEPFNPLGDTDY